MHNKLRYKMFKKGKIWCSMALAIGAVALTEGVTNTVAYADNSNVNIENNTQTSSAATSSTATSSAVTSSAATSSAATSSAATSSAATSSAATSSTAASSAATSSSKVIVQNKQNDLAKTKIDSSSEQVTDETKNGLFTEDGHQYYYKNGVKQVDTFYQDATTKNSYYFGKDGSIVKDSFVADTGNWYYFGKNGVQLKNQFFSKWDNWYYFGEDGSQSKNNFVTVWGNWYYFGADGVQVKDNFATQWGNWYYFASDGVQVKNNFASKWGNWYYFAKDGNQVKDNFTTKWGNWYYFGADGNQLKENFATKWGNWYYFGADGNQLKDKFWSKWNNIYYFGADGNQLKNTSIYLGYGGYSFNSAGVLIYKGSDFLSKIGGAAIVGWKQYGVLPSLTLAQAILESGWGTSSLATRYNNLFGIKGSYNGQSVNLPTGEFYSGAYVTVVAGFRSYPDIYASVVDHSVFLTNNSRNSRYSNLLWDRSSDSVTLKIRQDGYATSPTYTQALRNIISQYGLNSFDQIAFRL